jgi:transcriptional regulator with XRE-family HTH domain
MPRPRGYDKHFGYHALRNLREWQGITPTELADRVVAAGGRLSAQTVRNIESGTTRPSLSLLDQLLAALQSDPEHLEQVRVQLIEADEERKAQATWSSMINPPEAGLDSAAAPPAQTEAPSVVRRARARSLSSANRAMAANARAVPGAQARPPVREANPDRPSLPAPKAPEPWEALRELGDIYSQLNATGRHALIGRARQLLATQHAADTDATPSR